MNYGSRQYRRRRRTNGAAKKKRKTMDVVLVVVGVLLIAFTLKMIHVFETTGAIPDTLCTCVFAALSGECGIMGWIKVKKDKYTDRKWKQEDREREKREVKENDF